MQIIPDKLNLTSSGPTFPLIQSTGMLCHVYMSEAVVIWTGLTEQLAN